MEDWIAKAINSAKDFIQKDAAVANDALSCDRWIASSALPATDASGRPTLRRDATGDSVKEIQSKIGVSASGVFDAMTEAAVRQFQRDHGLVPDGIVGPRTWAALLA